MAQRTPAGHFRTWLPVAVCLAVIGIPAWAAIPAHPGVVNYIEGSAFINGRQVSSKNVGSTELYQNQILKTGRGKAEVLLTPGVFLRMGDNSELRMVSAGLTDTRVELLRGEAMVEATEILKENNIR